MSDRSSAPPVLPGLTYVRQLGRGGYADVYLYEQTSPRMRVAVKVLFGDGVSDRARERFADEANAMAQLADHPNIVQVFRADVTEDGRPYLVMKYYPQRNLAVRAATEQISVPEVLRIGVQVACAVETAHRVGILHRDIKPANILTSQYGEPGLTDFGIATTGADGEGDAEGLSLPWSPPEIVFGDAASSRSSDVYSLGATLWHLLVGHPPFEEPSGDNSTPALMQRIREFPPPQTGRPDVPPSLERLLAQAMAKTPLDRPKSALQLARGLQAVELDQRWSATPLVLADSEGVHDVEAGSAPLPDSTHTSRGRARAELPRPLHTDDEPATRHRPAHPQPREEVPGRPPAGPSTRPRSDRAGAARLRKSPPPPPDEPGTVVRPRVARPEPDASVDHDHGRQDEQRQPSRRLRLVLGAVAVVVVVGTAGGAALAMGGGKRRPSPPSTSSERASTGPTIVSNAPTAAPTQPVGTRINPTQVHFSWTVPDEQPGEVVGWATTTRPNSITTVNSNRVTIQSKTPVCIVVYAKDASGQQVSQSTPGCAR